MYTVTNTFGISKQPNSRWGAIDLTSMPVHDIFFNYRKLYLTLTAAFLTEPVFVDFEVFRLKYSSFPGTVDEMFTDNDTDSFDTVSSIPTPNVKYAYFKDAFKAGYSVQMVGRSLAFGSNIPRSERKDLVIKRSIPVTNMQDVYNHCLFTVNGYFHITDTDGVNLYVLNGGASSYKSRQNQLGIWSFKNIAPIKSIPISENMLFKQADSSTFSTKTYIKLNENIDNKTIMLSLGGYLVRMEKDIFFPIGNNTFCINLGNLPLLERYYESLECLNLSSLGLESSTNNSRQVSIEEFYSDAVITKYLTLEQSFIIILDKEDVFFNQFYLRHSNLPGMFTSYTEPKYPLFTGQGKVSEYWSVREDGQWAVNVQDSFLQNKVFSGVVNKELQTVGDSKAANSTFFNSRGYMLELGCDF